jgi:hypothetical protein
MVSPGANHRHVMVEIEALASAACASIDKCAPPEGSRRPRWHRHCQADNLIHQHNLMLFLAIGTLALPKSPGRQPM